MKKPNSDKKKEFQLDEQQDFFVANEGFKIPDGYFSTLESDLNAKIEALEYLTNESPINNFDVPDRYFEELTNNIQKQISTSRPDSLAKEWASILFRPKIALAFASLFIILWFTVRTTEDKTISPTDNQITFEEFSDSDYLMDFDDVTIIEALAKQQDPIIINPASDPYIQYLLDHHIDISQIENSL